jgi:uncharacterized protein YdaU (DUF1376 family)
MSLADHGVYNILLDASWEEEPTATIPADLAVLSKITGVEKRILSRFLAKYQGTFMQSPDDSQRLFNPRLRSEYHQFLEQCESKRLAGIASGKARQKKRTPVQHSLNNTDSDTDTDKRERQNPRAARPAAPADPRFQSFYESAFESYLRKHGQKPSWLGKDRKQLQTLLRATPALPIEELQRRWGNYLASTETFTVKQGFALAYFCTHFDSFVAGPICGPKEKTSGEDIIRRSAASSGLDASGQLKQRPN